MIVCLFVADVLGISGPVLVHDTIWISGGGNTIRVGSDSMAYDHHHGGVPGGKLYNLMNKIQLI